MFKGCFVVTRCWWFVSLRVALLGLTVETVPAVPAVPTAMPAAMASQDGLGDDGHVVDCGGDGLVDQVRTVREHRAVAHDRRGGDVAAEVVTDDNTGEAARSGEGDSQDGGEDSLRRRDCQDCI